MPKIIRDTTVRLPPPLTSVTEENFIRYLTWLAHAEILNAVRKQVEEATVAKSQYTRFNRPERQANEFLKVGSVPVMITTTPTNGRVSYANAYRDFKDFLEFLNRQYENKVSRKGVKTLNGRPYVELSVARAALEESIARQKRAASAGTISHKIYIPSGSPLITPDVPEAMVIEMGGRNYRAFTETNIVVYHQAGNMLHEGQRRVIGYKEGDTNVEMFKKLLLKDTLEQLGGFPETPRRLSYPFENYTFEHQVEPRANPQYAAAIDELLKNAPPLIKVNSKIGDFVVLGRISDKPFISGLESKGLIDGQFNDDYSPQVIDGRIFISLDGLRKRLDAYKEKHIERSIEQNIAIAYERLLRAE